MNEKAKMPSEIFDELIARYPQLEACAGHMRKAYDIICAVYRNGGTLYIPGNGGSAADSEHISGELMKSFMFKRAADVRTADRLKELYGEEGEKLSAMLEGGLPAVSLPSLVSLSTAISNDVGGDVIFAQMINAIAGEKDCFLAISTSGNSKNIVLAAMAAKAKGVKIIGLTGRKECKLDSICDTVVHMPETETFKIQELHLPVYHALCAMVEAEFFG